MNATNVQKYPRNIATVEALGAFIYANVQLPQINLEYYRQFTPFESKVNDLCDLVSFAQPCAPAVQISGLFPLSPVWVRLDRVKTAGELERIATLLFENIYTVEKLHGVNSKLLCFRIDENDMNVIQKYIELPTGERGIVDAYFEAFPNKREFANLDSVYQGNFASLAEFLDEHGLTATHEIGSIAICGRHVYKIVGSYVFKLA